MSVINATDTVILKLPSGQHKPVSLSAGTVCSIGKFGSFLTKHLVGQRWGYTYEANKDKTLSLVAATALQDALDEGGNNEFIMDANQHNQVLSQEEIMALRDAGDSEALIQKLKDNNKTFALKTDYSKAKYEAKKLAKYSSRFTVVEPTAMGVLTFLMEKDWERVGHLTQESLAFMLTTADVRPGAHYLIAESISGLLVAALLERGAIITMVHEPEAPPLDNLKYFPHYEEKQLKQSGRLYTLNWHEAAAPDEVIEELTKYIDARKDSRIPKDAEKIERRRQRIAELEGYKTAQFDGLLIMTEHTATSTVPSLLPRLGLSRKVCVFSPTREPLLALRQMTSEPLLAQSIIELRAREIQVLRGRTRPVMTKRGEWGYIFHAIKIERMAETVAVGARARPQRLKPDEAADSAVIEDDEPASKRQRQA